MARQKSNTTGLRQLLIAAADAQREAWRRPQPFDYPGKNRELPMLDGERALRAGEPVVVTAGEMFDALHHAGLDWRPYTRMGSEAGKSWVLDGDKLTEIQERDRDL